MGVHKVEVPSGTQLREQEREKTDAVKLDHWIGVAESLHRKLEDMFDALKSGKAVALVNHRGHTLRVEAVAAPIEDRPRRKIDGAL